jgi:starch synthase
VGGYAADVRFHSVELADRARVLLADVPELYDREHLYGTGNVDYPDNARRFGVLARAALEFAARRRNPPAVFHAHDWQAGLVPVYLKTMYANHPILGGTPSICTIHNLAYQGLFEADWLPRLDLPWSLLSVDQLEYWGRISFLKGGINNAEIITTVSETYAREIQTPDFGFGFDGILRRRATDLVGILNGIDTAAWDPAHDVFLPAPYGPDDFAGKQAAKREVLVRYELPANDETMARPLVGMISRMVAQKGLDLIAALAAELPQLDATFIVLGTGEKRYQDLWTTLASRYPRRIGVRIGFDEALAHLIEAGSDMFLMPSYFEPCGLNQMYSLRYGTIPIVRASGGLADTVQDVTTRGDGPAAGAAVPIRGGPAGRRTKRPATGFVFHPYTPTALLEALNRALATFQNRRAWRALQRAGMKQDHSWDRSAREYVRIYERATGTVRRNGREPRQRS